MDPEIKDSESQETEHLEELLRENLELNKENNELLKSMSRTARWNFMFNIAKWVIIIGSALGIYYYFGQMFANLLETYKDLLTQDSAETATTASSRLEQLREQVGSLQDLLR